LSVGLPALVLTAGLGTRLFPLSLTRAKPAAPLAGVPLIERILRQLATQGISEAVLNLHARPASIAALVGDGSQYGLRVRYSWEHPRVLGSAGGPRRALPLMRGPLWLIVNGDTLTDLALADLTAAHAASGARVTMAVVPNREPARYGGVLVADDGAVVGFTRRGHPGPSWHFVGFQVVDASVFAPLADGVPADTVGGLYPTLMASDPGAVRAWRTDATFLDVGTARDYWHSSLALDGRTPPRAQLGARCRIAASARVAESILWDDVVVGEGATLERCVVADRARIPAGWQLADCAVAPAVEMDPRAGGGGLIVVPFDPQPEDRRPRAAEGLR
jgi:NDP-sugar pyrophosphorylase family protein